MTRHATTAAEAFDRYDAALTAGTLIQSAWHREVDGRQLACGLGVIGSDINGPRDCPAAIMPRWLAQMVPWLFDNQEPAVAFAWGKLFYGELARLDGKVPFEAVYGWNANVACQIGIEAAENLGLPVEPHVALQALHRRAMTGDRVPADDWRPVLRNAYAAAYAYADANADADADADAYADAYAYANADAYADANADADAYANANADADADAYAAAYAHAYKQVINRLATGLVDCLSRVLA